MSLKKYIFNRKAGQPEYIKIPFIYSPSKFSGCSAVALLCFLIKSKHFITIVLTTTLAITLTTTLTITLTITPANTYHSTYSLLILYLLAIDKNFSICYNS